MSHQETKVLKARLRDNIWQILVCLIFTIIGAGMIASNAAHGWWVFICSGFGVVVLLTASAATRNQLTLSDSGVSIKTMGRESHIRWKDVESFHLGNINGNKVICVYFDKTYLKQKVSRGISTTVSNEEAVIPGNYGMKVEELCALLNEWLDRYKHI